MFRLSYLDPAFYPQQDGKYITSGKNTCIQLDEKSRIKIKGRKNAFYNYDVKIPPDSFMRDDTAYPILFRNKSIPVETKAEIGSAERFNRYFLPVKDKAECYEQAKN